MQGVVESGTGKRAQLSDGRPVAGKTGTTENYGDAWFVGYTPQLAVAVWVGYPDRLRPMLDEYHGSPVAGGTFPAKIFKSFMEKALPRLEAEPEAFPSPSYPYASPRNIVFRDGALARGQRVLPRHAPGSLLLRARARDTKADCKPNEVEVPRVLGLTYEQAVERLALQPLEAEPVFKPAVPRQRVGYVLGQLPKVGARLSAYDTVQLVVAKPVYGVVPRVIGLPLAKARERLDERQLLPVVRRQKAEGRAGRVLSQRPLVGSGRRSRHAGQIDGRGAGRLRNREPASTYRQGSSTATVRPMRGPARTSSVVRRGACSSNGGRSSRSPSCSRVTPSAWQRRPGPAQRSRGLSSPRRAAIASRPAVGSSARMSTAWGEPSSPHTKFRHQCTPYER